MAQHRTADPTRGKQGDLCSFLPRARGAGPARLPLLWPEAPPSHLLPSCLPLRLQPEGHLLNAICGGWAGSPSHTLRLFLICPLAPDRTSLHTTGVTGSLEKLCHTGFLEDVTPEPGSGRPTGRGEPSWGRGQGTGRASGRGSATFWAEGTVSAKL